jgi:cytochrome c oxidase subunit 3
MVNETTSTADSRAAEIKPQQSAKKLMLWIGIIGIVMFFSSLLSAFIVSKGGKFWVNISLPQAFWISTGVIIGSSLTLNMALQAIKKNNLSLNKVMLLVTLVLGVVFAVFQFIGYNQLINSGNYFTAKIMKSNGKEFELKGEYGKDFTITYNEQILEYKEGRLFFPGGKELNAAQYEVLKSADNMASSYIYVISALHIIHLLAGLLYLLYVTILAHLYKFDGSNYFKISQISVYWHFLGVLWIFLFLFFQFIH